MVTRRILTILFVSTLWTVAGLRMGDLFAGSTATVRYALANELDRRWSARDLFWFSRQWMKDPPDAAADLDGNGVATIDDLLLFLQASRNHPTTTPSPEAPASTTPIAHSTRMPSTPSPTPTKSEATPTRSQPDDVRLWHLHPALEIFRESVAAPDSFQISASTVGYAVQLQVSQEEVVEAVFDRMGRIYNRQLPISTSSLSNSILVDGGATFGRFFESPPGTRRFVFEPFDFIQVIIPPVEANHLGADDLAWCFYGSPHGALMAVLRYPQQLTLHLVPPERGAMKSFTLELPTEIHSPPARMAAAIGGERIAVCYSSTQPPSGSLLPYLFWMCSTDGELITKLPFTIQYRLMSHPIAGDRRGQFYLLAEGPSGPVLYRISEHGFELDVPLPLSSVMGMVWHDELLWLLDGSRHALVGVNEHGEIENGPVDIFPLGWTQEPRWLRLAASGSDLGVFFTKADSNRGVYYARIEAGPRATPTPLPSSGTVQYATRRIDIGENTLLDLVLIDAGSYRRGSPDDEPGRSINEGPAHPVTLTHSFYISQFEITNRQFRLFDPTHRSPRASSIEFDGDDRPVTGVTWLEAEAFCEWLSGKIGETCSLPTEAEWEYVCRAGVASARYWETETNRLSICAHENIADASVVEAVYVETIANCSDGHVGPAPVGQFQPNPFGVYDMLGNVREWCRDWFVFYSGEPAVNPTGPSWGRSKAIRGGSWRDSPGSARAAFRSGKPADQTDNNLGFRVVIYPK